MDRRAAFFRSPSKHNMGLKKIFEMDDSKATVATEECSSCSSSSDVSSQESFAESKAVRFAATCEVHLVERFDDPDLWWQAEESQDIRNECIGIVQDAMDNSPLSDVTLRFLDKGWKEGVHCGQPLMLQMTRQKETRGLEHHVTTDYTEMVEDHMLAVLEDYESGMDANLLAIGSRRMSRIWVRLASLRAKFDEEEARSKI